METFDFCISQNHFSFHPITVDAIYYVLADKTYKVRHKLIPNSFVFVYTFNGEGEMLINQKKYHLQRSDFLVFDASQAPFFYHSHQNEWTFWWVEFRLLQPEFLELQIGEQYKIPLSDLQITLLNEALAHLKTQDSKTSSILFSSLISLLQKETPGEPEILQKLDFFRQADIYIRKHLQTATVSSTAEALKISERTLLNLFRKILGISTNQYIRNIKADMAKHLLIYTPIEIKKIAEELGYSDQFTFCKSFRNYYGHAPSYYRNLNKEIKPHYNNLNGK